MKTKLRLKKKTNTGPRQPNITRSMPIDRYYSSMSNRAKSADKNQGLDNKMRAGDQRFRRTGRMGDFLKTLFRFGGFIGISAILLFNTSLTQVGVKVSTPEGVNQVFSYRTDQGYVDAVSGVFSDSLVNRSKLFFNSSSYEARLVQQIPELEKAVAVIPLVGTKLQVGLTVTDPLLRAELKNGNSAIVGSNGKLLETASQLTTELSMGMPKLLIEPSLQAEIGETVLTSTEIELIKLMSKEFDGSNLDRPKLSTIRYIVEKREFHVTFSGTNFYGKLTSERESRTQVGALVAVIRDANSDPAKMPTQYVDVRVEGRVFIL